MSKSRIIIYIGCAVLGLVLGVAHQMVHTESINDKIAKCRSVGGHYSAFGTGRCYINGEEVFKDE